MTVHLHRRFRWPAIGLALVLGLSACGGQTPGKPVPSNGPDPGTNTGTITPGGLAPGPGSLMLSVGQTADGQPTLKLKDGRVMTMLRLSDIGYKPGAATLSRPSTSGALQALDTQLPARIDLRANSSFGRNQAGRGTCIVFSNVAGVEAAYKRLRGVTLDLSEQYMNAVRRTLELKVPASAAALPRAENLPASWGAGGSWDLQIYYMRQAGIPAEGFAPTSPTPTTK